MTTKTKKAGDENLDFEFTLNKLETLVNTMENRETKLEEALSAFETGVRLIETAQKILSEANQQVQLLLEQDNEPSVAELEPGEDS